MDRTMHFERVPLAEIKHIVEEVNQRESPALFSIQFAWSENHRFFYKVSLIGGPNQTFTVWIDGVQEAKWGTRVPTNGRETIGTCHSSVEKWCRMNFDSLPENGETKQIFLDEIPKPERG